MDIAALILSLIAILMSGTVLVIFLAKNVFSSHTVQLVPAESLVAGQKPQPIGSEFTEFDAPSAMDVAIEGKFKKAN